MSIIILFYIAAERIVVLILSLYTNGRSAEFSEERSARVQAAPHLYVVVHAILFVFQFKSQERQVHVHVGFGFDGPFARGVAVVVQIAVVRMRVEVFHVVRGYQPTTANCENDILEIIYYTQCITPHNQP